MFDINQQITSISDVETFAKYLYDEAKVAFHPDESFEDYVIVESDSRAFSKEESRILNKRMEESFAVCEREKEDIYDLMMQFSPIHSLI